MNIRVLGAHNTESRTTRYMSLLVDGVLALDAGGLTSSLSFNAQQKIKAILLTHHHYDHIRDIPAIAMNFYLRGKTISVYSTQSVYNALTTYLLNNELYPNLLERPAENPTVKFTLMEPLQTKQVAGYSVLAVPLNHSIPAAGYQVTSPDGKTIFYTGDTGAGLSECWKHVSPQLLLIEVTASDRFEEFARKSGHLAPGLLKQELGRFRELKGYLPQVVAVHMNPDLEKEIGAQLAAVSHELNSPITPAHEGMRIRI